MTQLAYRAIEDTFDWLSSIEDDKEIDALIDEFGDKQPFIFSFLLTIGEEDFNDEEREIFLYQGMFVWKVFDRNFDLTMPISENEIEAVKGLNLALIEEIELGKQSEKEALARGTVSNSDHPELLNYLIELLEEERDYIRPANLWVVFSFLKVLVDSFHMFSKSK